MTAAHTNASHHRDLNLTAHRTPGSSVWNRRGWDGTREFAVMRWLVGIGGAALAIEGFRRRGTSGSVFATAGGTLAWWALAGTGDLSAARERVSALIERVCGEPIDPVYEASADSFPASDAPSWTPVVAPRADRV